MVVLILVLVWVAALLPIALKKRSEWELSSSISDFRQRRRRLVRFAGATVDAGMAEDRHLGTARGGATSWGPSGGEPAALVDPAVLDARAARAARARRRALQARRRRALRGLLGTMAATLVLGAIPALRPLWDVTIAAALCSVAYLGALVWFRRAAELAVERDRKIIELAARVRQGAVVPLRPRPPFVIVEATS